MNQLEGNSYASIQERWPHQQLSVIYCTFEMNQKHRVLTQNTSMRIQPKESSMPPLAIAKPIEANNQAQQRVAPFSAQWLPMRSIIAWWTNKKFKQQWQDPWRIKDLEAQNSDFESMLGKLRTQSGTIAASCQPGQSPGDESRKCNNKGCQILDPMDFMQAQQNELKELRRTHGRRED